MERTITDVLREVLTVDGLRGLAERCEGIATGISGHDQEAVLRSASQFRQAASYFAKESLTQHDFFLYRQAISHAYLALAIARLNASLRAEKGDEGARAMLAKYDEILKP